MKKLQSSNNADSAKIANQNIILSVLPFPLNPEISQSLSDLVDDEVDNDDLLFQSESDSVTDSESESHQKQPLTLAPWKILIADDDTNVHDTTVLALNGVLIQGRPLTFIHAYSAQGAHKLISEQTDTALILLDVVMESSDAGLKLVPQIRNELGRKDLRIILRTGQPGYAKDTVLAHYQIDGYASKSQLTRSILIKMISEALINNDPSSKLH